MAALAVMRRYLSSAFAKAMMPALSLTVCGMIGRLGAPALALVAAASIAACDTSRQDQVLEAGHVKLTMRKKLFPARHNHVVMASASMEHSATGVIGRHAKSPVKGAPLAGTVRF